MALLPASLYNFLERHWLALDKLLVMEVQHAYIKTKTNAQSFPSLSK